MTRLYWLFGTVVAIALLVVLGTAALAQPRGVPPPYGGLKNPFPWDDAAAQAAGKGIYQRLCVGCHGATGNGITGSDFSTSDFAQSLKGSPDHYFWVLSEGRLDRGMFPFKSSLSEEQRWQVLTYIWSLGATPAPALTTVPPGMAPPAKPEATGKLLLMAPAQAQSGQPQTVAAVVRDSQDRPVVGATVNFFTREDFFASDLMDIGEAQTDDKGVAAFTYAPRQTGDTQVVARYGSIEAAATVSLTGGDKPFYRTEAGIKVPAPGKEEGIGNIGLGPNGEAPQKVLRLPTGGLSWLTPLLFVVIAIWSTYFFVLYQVFRISAVRKTGDTDTRLVPLAGLVMVVTLGILLVVTLITGPYSHLPLSR